MRGNKLLKEKVIKLRQRGSTYSEIQSKLDVSIPKSTLSNWCKYVKLPDEYQKRIKKIISNGAQKGRAIALTINQIKREKYLKGLRRKNLHLRKKLDKDVLKIALSMLYLGEGFKWKSSRYLGLGNSDPKIIRLYLKLLCQCFPVSKEKFRVAIGCRADQNIENLEKYWHSVTQIPLSQFHKTRVDKRTIGKKTRKKDYKGVCSIIYCDTEIQLELEQLAQQIMSGCEGGCCYVK